MVLTGWIFYAISKPQLQGVFKYEEFEDADNEEKKDITVGLNYFISAKSSHPSTD